MTLEDCSTSMAELVTLTSSWFEIDGAHFRHHVNCGDADLDPGTSTVLVKRLNHDWEGFCEHIARYHRGAHSLAMRALNPTAPAADVCAVYRFATGSCPQGLRLECLLLSKRAAYVLKQFNPPFPCAADLDREGRLEDVYRLADGTSVTLVTLQFEGGHHNFGHKVIDDVRIDTINGQPSYGTADDWPRRNVIRATLTLPDKTEVQLDTAGMYDPGPPDHRFRIERNGSGKSWILKARLGATSSYDVEWVIRDGRSVCTSIRRPIPAPTRPALDPDIARLKADLPPALKKCSIKDSSAWDYDGTNLDMIVRLRCPANDASQVVLRYAQEGESWRLFPRTDPFEPPTPIVAKRAPGIVPVQQEAPAKQQAPVPKGEQYPPATVQRKLMGDGSPPPVSERPAAGSVVHASNVAKLAPQLGPSLTWIVGNGARLKTAKYQRVALPYAVLVATQKYAAGVTMQPGSLDPVGYVAGLPFPEIAADDPQEATKLILNSHAATAADHLEVGRIFCDTGVLANGAAAIQVERHFFLDSFLRLYFTGRLEVEPRPKLEPNRDAVRYKEALYPLIEPFDLKGTGLLTSRYLDPQRADDSWLYLPQIRRIRRLSTVQRAEPLFGQDVDADSFGGFSANPVAFEWQLVGELTTIASLHDARNDKKPEYFPSTMMWEPRKVWVLEARPKIAEYPYGRLVLYLDHESYRIVRADLYDKKGQLWKGCVNSFQFPDTSPREGKVSVMQDTGTQSSMIVVDVQHRHATSCVLGPRSVDGGGWYINTGNSRAATEDAYSISPTLGGR